MPARRLSACPSTVFLALFASRLLAQGLALDTVEVATGLVRPVVVTHAGDGSGRLFIAQLTGQVLIWDGSEILATPFLDLSSEVVCCGERGLLGLAFHPDYAVNGEFFVNYTRLAGDPPELQTVVARYRVSDLDPDQADPASEEILLVLDQPAGNHNGGQLGFGPDGYLYIASGDGGGGGDPFETGQDLGELLGKILRIDIDFADPGLEYSVPTDNPFFGQLGARDEIWAYGLRNPWRFSFDRARGDIFIGDVGQTAWEEIDFQPAASSGGENYGWDCREGAHDYTDPNGDFNATCTGTGYTDPVLEYAHALGRCSVTGGYRYRGVAQPRLGSVYLYADYCTGEVFGTVPRCDAAWQSRVLLDAPFRITTFGEDEAGEVYVTDYRSDGSAQSRVLRLVLAAGSGGPDLETSPPALDFGTVEVGDTVLLEIVLSNVNGGLEAATVESSLSDPTLFALEPGAGSSPCRTARHCLPPGGSCSRAVVFQPDAPGAVSESILFEGNFAPESVPLTAQAVPCASAEDLVLTETIVTGAETHRACNSLTAGPDVSVTAGGELTLSAGTRIVLRDGFRVQVGGRLRAEIF